MVEKLCKLGLTVDAESVLARAHGGAVGRLHLAQELVDLGHCRTLRDVFDQYIAGGRPAHVPKTKVRPGEAIEMIKEAGGCAVLCHPCMTDGFEELLPELVDLGLDALEAHYPSHSADDEKHLMDLARLYGLGITGGSDFHGDSKPGIDIGQEFVSFVELCDLQQRALQRV
jgi:predicted metal-dependent phosphoesterase TrpH